MKRFVSLLLALVLLLSAIPFASAAGGWKNIGKDRPYTPGQFRDVPGGEWYAASVKTAFECGLVNGVSSDYYNPSGSITVAETLALACRIYKLYRSGYAQFEQGDPWYKCYWDFATENGIIFASDVPGGMNASNKAVTRDLFAAILSRTVPDSALAAINDIPAGSIPDVPSSNPYTDSIYQLYRAGVLTGNDDYGTFTPKANIQRSAVAAIVARMIRPNERKEIEFAPKVSSSSQMPAANDLTSYGQMTLDHMRQTLANPETIELFNVCAKEHVSKINGHSRIVIFVTYSALNTRGKPFKDTYISVYDMTNNTIVHDAMTVYYESGHNSTPGEEDKDLELSQELTKMIQDMSNYTVLKVS